MTIKPQKNYILCGWDFQFIYPKLVVVIGLPGCGKSTFLQNYDSRYRKHDDFIGTFYDNRMMHDLHSHRIIISDPRLCDWNIFIKYWSLLKSLIQNLPVHWVIFDNNLPNVLRLVANTERDNTQEIINYAAKYDPHNYHQWKREQKLSNVRIIKQPVHRISVLPQNEISKIRVLTTINSLKYINNPIIGVRFPNNPVGNMITRRNKAALHLHFQGTESIKIIAETECEEMNETFAYLVRLTDTKELIGQIILEIKENTNSKLCKRFQKKIKFLINLQGFLHEHKFHLYEIKTKSRKPFYFALVCSSNGYYDGWIEIEVL